MENLAIEWTTDQVFEYFKGKELEEQAQFLKNQLVRGIDLLEITESDVKFDFSFCTIHQRKEMLRIIQRLKDSIPCYLTVEYHGENITFRVSEIENYSFKQLSSECSRVFNLAEGEIVFKDKSGFMFGSGSVSIVFNANKVQKESVFISVFESEISVNSIDSEDFNEHNPTHICLNSN